MTSRIDFVNAYLNTLPNETWASRPRLSISPDSNDRVADFLIKNRSHWVGFFTEQQLAKIDAVLEGDDVIAKGRMIYHIADAATRPVPRRHTVAPGTVPTRLVGSARPSWLAA